MSLTLGISVEARTPTGWAPLYDTRWDGTIWWDDTRPHIGAALDGFLVHAARLEHGLDDAMPLLTGISRTYVLGNPWRKRGIGGRAGVVQGLGKGPIWPNDASACFQDSHTPKMGWLLWSDLQHHRYAILHSRPRTLFERLFDRWIHGNVERLSATAAGLHMLDDALHSMMPALLGVGCPGLPTHGLAKVDASWLDDQGPLPTAHQTIAGRAMRQDIDGKAPSPTAIRLLFHTT